MIINPICSRSFAVSHLACLHLIPKHGSGIDEELYDVGGLILWWVECTKCANEITG